MNEEAERYWVEADNVKAEVEINVVAQELVPIYFLKLPKIEAGTLALLQS